MSQMQKLADTYARHHKLAMKWVQEALFDMHPMFRIQESIRLSDTEFSVLEERFSWFIQQEIYVAGVGKASIEMALGLEKVFGKHIKDGLIIAPHVPKESHLKYIQVLKGKHPIPDEHSLAAGLELLDFIDSIPSHALVFFLISVGASSLIAYPSADIPLEDFATTYRLLLNAGAEISEMNTVRRHMCELKGGKLISRFINHRLITLAVSDVPFDALHDIGSGPTVPDPTHFDDAILVLRKYGLWDKTPASVREHLLAGLKNERPENPKPGSTSALKHHTALISSGKQLLHQIAALAHAEGYNVFIEPEYMHMEARDAARYQSALAIEVLSGKAPLTKPAVLLFSGENPVTVKGSGVGGRNQELALAAAISLEGQHSISCFAFATDGRDGETDASGAISSSNTALLARKNGLEPERFLKENDSWHFHQSMNTLLPAMKTGNNLMDLQIYIVE